MNAGLSTPTPLSLTRIRKALGFRNRVVLSLIITRLELVISPNQL
jgi:hypothetical protein